MLNWARQTGRIQNRLELTNKEKSRSRVLSLEELRRVWISSFELGTFGVIVRLLILTAQRRGEIANIHLCKLTTSHAHTAEKSITTFQTLNNINGKTTPSNNTITWNAHQTKNMKEHSLPLTLNAYLESQDLAQRITKQGQFNTWSKPKTALDKLSGVTNWTLHDLRSGDGELWACSDTRPFLISYLQPFCPFGQYGFYGSVAIVRYLTELFRNVLQYTI